MPASDLHASAIVIDGLVISNWDRKVFEDMHRGGLTAANCTVSVWENFRDTMGNIARFLRWIDDNDDLLMPVHSANDIHRAKAAGKVGVIFGFQNTSAIEDRLETLALFKKLGVGVMQLTYNTQNLVGSGCWEETDSGLSGFGGEVVGEMNRLGIVIDLSHVGAKTSREAIEASKRPVAYSHICPAALFDHPRNKTDDQLRFIIERGGFVGLATFPPFLPKGAETTVDDCVEVFEYLINICGEANVGIGTDFTQGQDEAFFDWLRHDKGDARRMVAQRGTAAFVKGLETLADYPNLTAAMQKRGWSEDRIGAVLGGNWLRFLAESWGEAWS